MEAHEVAILERLGIDDPYSTHRMSDSEPDDDRHRDAAGSSALPTCSRASPRRAQELMETLRYAADRDLIDVDVLNILFGAIAVADMHARDVMIPRSQLVCVKVDASPRQFLPIVIESQHSRFPVIGDDVDDVRGILHAKDMLPLLLQDEWDDFDIKDCMRPAAVIPESKRLNVLLQEFRANRNHMAIVIDEYGHVSGAVTIEDVLEQIVGDIEDEHDVDDEDRHQGTRRRQLHR